MPERRICPGNRQSTMAIALIASAFSSAKDSAFAVTPDVAAPTPRANSVQAEMTLPLIRIGLDWIAPLIGEAFPMKGAAPPPLVSPWRKFFLRHRVLHKGSYSPFSALVFTPLDDYDQNFLIGAFFYCRQSAVTVLFHGAQRDR